MNGLADFTVLVIEGEGLLAAIEEDASPLGGTLVNCHVDEGMAPEHLLALLLIAATPFCLPHQRVKLLSIIKEIEAGLDFPPHNLN